MKQYFSLIKFSHTIFALPFALIGVAMGWYSLDESARLAFPISQKLGLVVLCMVFARSAAMAFNRYLDRDIDSLNERTRTREIPAGIIRPNNALAFVIINSGLFSIASFMLNPLCGWLSFVALAVVLGYSYTKRFTALCHVVLGVGLGLAPVGAYLALTEHFDIAPIVLGIAVVCWVSGFDIIYALQDETFDRSNKLHSIPAWLGRNNALHVSEGLHLASAASIIAFCWLIQGSYAAWAGVLLFCGMLIWQHRLVRPDDLSRVNAAFFTANGIASVAFAVCMLTDFWLTK